MLHSGGGCQAPHIESHQGMWWPRPGRQSSQQGYKIEKLPVRAKKETQSLATSTGSKEG